VLKLADWDIVIVSVDGILFQRKIPGGLATFVVHEDDIPNVLQHLRKYEKEGEIRYLSGNNYRTILEILTCG
jgi:hypothetical protein